MFTVNILCAQFLAVAVKGSASAAALTPAECRAAAASAAAVVARGGGSAAAAAEAAAASNIYNKKHYNPY
jgi:hypothetical protein